MRPTTYQLGLAWTTNDGGLVLAEGDRVEYAVAWWTDDTQFVRGAATRANYDPLLRFEGRDVADLLASAMRPIVLAMSRPSSYRLGRLVVPRPAFEDHRDWEVRGMVLAGLQRAMDGVVIRHLDTMAHPRARVLGRTAPALSQGLERLSDHVPPPVGQVLQRAAAWARWAPPSRKAGTDAGSQGTSPDEG